MKIPTIILVTASLVLGGCQTIEEAATAKVLTVCTKGGYGPSSPQHSYCLNTLKPAAVQVERQRRARAINEGLDEIAEALGSRQPRVTCTQRGDTVRCY